MSAPVSVGYHRNPVRRAFVTTGVAFSVLCMLGACSAVPDITFVDDAGPIEGGGPDGGPVPGCTPSGAEICDDGIDNDCNGQTDCGDSACTAGYACVPAPPNGWQLVGFNASAKPNCPPGFGAAQDISTVTGTGAGQCACQCSAALGSTACNAGQSVVTVSDSAACSGGATTTRMVASSPTGCATLGGGLAIPAGQPFAKLTPPAPPLACTSATTSNVPSVTSGRVCAPPARLGAGCGMGQVCAPKPTDVSACVAKPGLDVCPAAYPKANSAGSSFTDNRGCNTASCSCTPQASCGATLTLFTDPACSVAAGGKSVTLTPTCNAPSSKNVTVESYKGTTTGSGCSAAGFVAASTGSIAWVAQQTICCK